MSILRVALCAALLSFGLVGPLSAQDITLTSRDKAVEISGTLLGYDGEFYRVDTIYGELTVDGSGVSCSGPACPNLEDFVAKMAISGSQAIGNVLMPALVEAFASQRGFTVTRNLQSDSRFTYVLGARDTAKPVAEFAFHVSNTDEGFADLLAGEADAVLALRQVRDSERKRAREAGLGDLKAKGRARVLALDALVPVVAPNNPLRALTSVELARVFSGEIDDWSQLGGPEQPIALHIPDPATGLAQGFEDLMLRPLGGFAENTTPHKSLVALVDTVARDPFAIGLTSFSETGNAEVVDLVGTCGFRQTATVQSIKTEDHALTAPLYLYTPARRLPKVAREFLRFVRSDRAQHVVRRAGFVDQRPVEIDVDAQGRRLANAIEAAGPELDLAALKAVTQVLATHQRLSLTFRFETGSTRLDAPSQESVLGLVKLMETGALDGREVLFVGFSDGAGAAEGNQKISERRAATVRDAVVAAAKTADRSKLAISAQGFGEGLPMACDDTELGRSVNRRVEVWLR